MSLTVALSACGGDVTTGEAEVSVGQGQALLDGTYADAVGAMTLNGKVCSIFKIAPHTLMTAESCIQKLMVASRLNLVFAKEFAEKDSPNQKITTVVTEIHRFGSYEIVTEGADGVALPVAQYVGSDVALIRTEDSLGVMKAQLDLDFTPQDAGVLLTTLGYGCPIQVGVFEFARMVYRLQKAAVSVLAVGPKAEFSGDFLQSRSRVATVCEADAGGPLLRFIDDKPAVVGVNAGHASDGAKGDELRVGVHSRIDSQTIQNADGLTVAEWLKGLLK